MGGLVRDIQVNAIEAAFFHFEVDRSGDDVARREFRPLIVPEHETRAIGELQQPALAAYCFADEERFGVRMVEARRVKLDELHVGDAAAGAPAHGDAIAGRRVRIGGIEIHLSGAAGGEHGAVRGNGPDLARRLVQHVGPVAAAGATMGRPRAAQFHAGDEIDGDMMFEHRDIRMGACLFAQRGLHRLPGRIGRVDDPPHAVAPFAGQMIAGPAALVPGKRHALLDEPLDGLRTVFHHITRGRFIAKTGAGDQRVANMGCG